MLESVQRRLKEYTIQERCSKMVQEKWDNNFQKWLSLY